MRRRRIAGLRQIGLFFNGFCVAVFGAAVFRDVEKCDDQCHKCITRASTRGVGKKKLAAETASKAIPQKHASLGGRSMIVAYFTSCCNALFRG